MMEISKVNKRYRKNHKNELHVLKDVDLTFPEKGLVAIVGASGSGKTTLLNVLSGMDAADSGTISVGEHTLKTYRTRVFDALRTEHIGMVFQNYYLLEDKTVYENIALTLKMIGFDDENAIAQRVAHVLESVRMHKYTARLAGQLSGGQQQRVAIARALAKDPAVLLADEPTGNLDSRNTLDIMNILSGVAQARLVVLVTHERDMANHFADRIVEIEDGRIVSDVVPTRKSDYKHGSETDIYLHDLPVHAPLKETAPEITYYGDEPLDAQANVRLVYKNGTLYIGIRNQPFKKIVILGKDSDVHLLEASEADRKALDETAKPLTLKPLEKPALSRFTKPFYSIFGIFKDTVVSMVHAPRGRKFIYLAFVLGAMVVANAVSNLFNILTIDDADILTMPKNTIVVTDRDILDYDAFLALGEHPHITGVRLAHQAMVKLRLPPLYTPYGTGTVTADFEGSFVPLERLAEQNIVLGEAPASPFEVVIDRMVVERTILPHFHVRVFDITTVDALIGMEILLDLGNDVSVPVRISGIADTNAPVMYAEEALIAAFFENNIRGVRPGQARQARFLPFELLENDLHIIEGSALAQAREMLIPSGYEIAGEPVSIDDIVEYMGISYTVVGRYEWSDGADTLPLTRVVLSLEDIQELYFLRTTSNDTERYLYAADIDEALSTLTSLGYDARSVYRETRARILEQALFMYSGSFTFSLVSLIGMVVGLYFIIRAAMISRIYELGVLRALGVKKRTLIGRALFESFIIATATSIVGFSIMTYFISRTQSALGGLLRLGHISVLSVTTGILLLYAVNLFSGYLPLAMLLRKKPAEIINKYDI